MEEVPNGLGFPTATGKNGARQSLVKAIFSHAFPS
jgi:hypothetical protein